MFKFGIIGAGNIANKFCNAVKLVADAEVVAVSSATQGKAEAFAKENNIEDYFSSYEDMLKDVDIDGVYIATTHNFHYENALLCIKYNKPFICEKAFMINYAQASDVFKKAKEKNLFAMEAMWSRFLPTINKAREWIESGRLGKIDLATFQIGFKAEENPENRMYSKALGGGAMFDIGVYAIEIMTYLINENIVDVKSTISKAELGEVDKVDSMIIKFDNCIASLNCIISARCENAIKIYGTSGMITIDNPHYSNTVVFTDNDGNVETFYSPLENGFEYQISEMINCIRGGKCESDIIPHKDTLQCAKIFDTCLGQKK